MEKYIHVTKETREFLKKVFNTTTMSVWRALNYANDTALSKRIRKCAFERGGILMAVSPCIETFHDYDGYMRQYLPNGALIEISKVDSSGDVFFKGKKVKHYDEVWISQTEGIQNWAMGLK